MNAVDSASERTVREELEARGFELASRRRPATIASQVDAGIGFEEYGLVGYLEHYAFRKVLRHLVVNCHRVVPDEEIARQIASQKVVQEYGDVLAMHEIIERGSDGWRLALDVTHYGPTFEWYVARVVDQQLHWAADWNVHLKGCHDNDFDVVGVRGGRVMLIECKAGKPESVAEDGEALAAFVRRTEFLGPTLSILLLETDTSIERVVEAFEQHVLRPGPMTAEDVSGRGDAYWIGRGYYAARAHRGVRQAIGACMRHQHRTSV